MAHDQESSNFEQPQPPVTVDDIIEQSIRNMSCIQLFQAILAALMPFFDGQQTLISIFTDAEPTWHCRKSDAVCTSTSNICNLPAAAWEWDQTPQKTIISEWHLECASLFITGLPSAAFFVGCLIGGLTFAASGDSFLGRKNLLIFSSLLMSVAAFGSSFSVNIWMYAGLRLMSGMGRGPVASTALVLITEKTAKSWRNKSTFMIFLSYSLGGYHWPL